MSADGADETEGARVVEEDQRTLVELSAPAKGASGTNDLSMAKGQWSMGDDGSLDIGDAQGQDPLIGLVVGGRYRIVECIGRGGMGVVYKVEHTEIGKLLALKLLAGELSRQREDSLGALMYEALNGEPVFRGSSPMVVPTKHLTESPIPPRRRATDRLIPPALEDIVLRALAKDPNQRFQAWLLGS